MLCTFDGITDFAEAQDADKRILITTPPDPDCDAVVPVDWEIIELEP